jgi:hypothetical protein
LHSSSNSVPERPNGDQHRVVTQKANPLKKLPRDNEGILSYLARLVELMATGDVKEGRYAAARLE